MSMPATIQSCGGFGVKKELGNIWEKDWNAEGKTFAEKILELSREICFVQGSIAQNEERDFLAVPALCLVVDELFQLFPYKNVLNKIVDYNTEILKISEEEYKFPPEGAWDALGEFAKTLEENIFLFFEQMWGGNIFPPKKRNVYIAFCIFCAVNRILKTALPVWLYMRVFGEKEEKIWNELINPIIIETQKIIEELKKFLYEPSRNI